MLATAPRIGTDCLKEYRSTAVVASESRRNDYKSIETSVEELRFSINATNKQMTSQTTAIQGTELLANNVNQVVCK